jgi:hypothetical protein
MGMKEEFIAILKKFEHKILFKLKEPLVKVYLSKICGDFGLFRIGSMYLFSAFDFVEQSLKDSKENDIQKVELLFTIIETLGISRARDGYLKLICNSSSEKPLVSKAIIDFLISNLYKLNFSSDSRYVNCLLFLLKLSPPHLKSQIWKSIISCNSSVSHEEVYHELDLPYFSYIYAKPNPRKVRQENVIDTGPVDKKINGQKLFLYDPRDKSVKLNWSSGRSEDVIVYLYNPLPFDLVINSLELCTSDVKSMTHSGKIHLSAFEKKKKTTVKLKILEEGEAKISGVKFLINSFYYVITNAASGISSLLTKNPSLGSEPIEAQMKQQDLHSLKIFPTLPDIKASLIIDLDEKLAIGEEIDFKIRV